MLLADSNSNAYPKRFLLLGMLLFKDVLPILASNHPESASISLFLRHRLLKQSSLRLSSSPPYISSLTSYSH